jgi:3-hydroxymyristoyl/3-hydroxydecanoyl-(acyl carrier protein) dehydratase
MMQGGSGKLMSDHFAAFSFVDRITRLEPGMRVRGTFAVPVDLAAFPACLVAEAVGQLAAWAAMSQIDFRGRPVAALATETVFHRDVVPGSSLDLAVEIESCDDDAVAYSGSARCEERLAIELKHCLGPMLPVQDFDSPDALRDRFRLLCATGATPGRFHGVAAPELVGLQREDGKSARALLHVPRSAPFFADHFPRRPVFPATLLLDSQIRLAMDLARAAIDAASATLLPQRMTHVKMRSFIEPGQDVLLGAEMTGATGRAGTVRLSAVIADRTVATARLDIAARSEE